MTPSDRINLYTIRLEGHLDPRWLRVFENLEIILLPDGETLIEGCLDQSALDGLLGFDHRRARRATAPRLVPRLRGLGPDG